MSISLLALVLAALPPQSQLPATRVHPVTAPVRDAGILHVATNTWTRKASAASIGADVVYNNSCSSGYYTGFSGDTFVTNGRVPSPSSPTNAVSRPGCAVSYTVDGFEFAYCTDSSNVGVITIDFYNAYDCCASVIGVTPTASFPLSSLPGSSSGALACWTVVIDLDGPPSTTFVLMADRDGVFDGSLDSTDGFGWSIRSSLPGTLASTTGPILASGAGCATCPNTDWDGTRWDSVVNYDETGTGMGTCGSIRIENGPTFGACYTLAACPDPNFHLRLFADACAGGLTTTFCSGDGTATPCPCGNLGLPGEGCRNSLGVGGRLRGSGVTSISNDTFALVGDQMPANAPTLYFQGTIQQGAGQGTQFGDGLRCAGGTTVRLGIQANSAQGASIYPAPGDPTISVRGQITVPGTRTYQAWYRNSANFCTSATFNLTNGVEIAWAP